MKFTCYTTATMEMVALAVEIILLVTNCFGVHRKDIKIRMYLISVFFMTLATLINMSWNFSGQIASSATSGMFHKAAVYIASYIGTSFIGYYLIAIIDEKKAASKFFSALILVISLFGIGFVIWGCITNKVFYFAGGQVINGPLYRMTLYLVITLGECSILIVLTHFKNLGLKNSLISIIYFILPVIAVSIKAFNDDVDFIFASVAISELIVNDMMVAQEKSDIITTAEVAKKSAANKSSFLANMSHEIRTPINAVLGLNELILRESDDDNIIGYAHDIKSSGNQLLSLINDVLDFSKIESGKMGLLPVSYGVASLFNDIVNMITVRAKGKDLELLIDINPDIPSVLYGDEVRLKQIMTNLLTNAVKYTDAGHVKYFVTFEKLSDEDINLKVVVSDTGRGMEEDQIKNLYVEFERIDEKNNRNIEGTGLGMAITKKYLEMMGSNLTVNSIYGKGTSVSFSVKQKCENWEPIGDFKEAIDKLHKTNEKYTAKLHAPNAHVLIVDDMEMNLKVVIGLLKETQLNIDTATSGKEALEKTKNIRYNMIFLDHMMPQMSGIEVIAKLRADDNNPNKDTITVALTANAISGAKETYISAGFNDYLTKPIDTEKMENMLIKYLPKELLLDDVVEVQKPLPKKKTSRLEYLAMIEGVDVNKGIEVSANEDIYMMVVEEFVIGVDEVIENIKSTREARDDYEYTVQVHGLKSMARQAGAVVLGDAAYELEMAGHEKNWDLIDAKTESVIEMTLEMKKRMANAMNITI